jgi:hypothetical protein
MAPKTTKPKASYQCPLLLSPDDVKALRDASVSLAAIATMMSEVKEMTVDNHHTLRGHNGDAGMVAEFSALRQQVSEMATCLDTLKDVPHDLATLQGKVEALKDVPAAIDTWKRYPSLTYMIRHNFKPMAIITTAAVVVTIAFGFPDPARGEQLRSIIELLFAKWLRL